MACTRDVQYSIMYLLALAGIVVAIVLCGIVIDDVQEVASYDKSLCLGPPMQVSVTCSSFDPQNCHARALVNRPNDTQVELFFPPVKHYSLVRKSRNSCESWLSGFSSAASFVCFVDESSSDPVVGVTSELDTRAGWIVGLVLSVLACCILIGGGVYVLIQNCKE